MPQAHPYWGLKGCMCFSVCFYNSLYPFLCDMYWNNYNLLPQYN